jgi:methylglutaconyl-CoA hydratase
MPPAIAAELFLGGERVSAERAKEAGLVTRVVADDDLDVAVAGYVAALQLGGPNALARTKELLRRVPTMSLADGFAWTAQLSADLFGSPEAAEGMTAFLDRRPPSWAPR